LGVRITASQITLMELKVAKLLGREADKWWATKNKITENMAPSQYLLVDHGDEKLYELVRAAIDGSQLR
jgi:hypothetical protein